MSSNRPNLTLDERAFEGLLSAAFTIQEHNDRQKPAQPTVVTEAEASTLCRHCGALKPSDTSPCGTCGLEEFRPGVAKRLGIDYSMLSARNPRLVYCAVTGFGQTGPDRGRMAYDLIIQAMGGVMGLTGAEGGGPQ